MRGGTRLRDFPPGRAIQIHEPNLASHHHVSSVSALCALSALARKNQSSHHHVSSVYATFPNSPIANASSPYSAPTLISAPVSRLSPTCARTVFPLFPITYPSHFPTTPPPAPTLQSDSVQPPGQAIVIRACRPDIREGRYGRENRFSCERKKGSRPAGSSDTPQA
jgi:hypothetical protein